jgi:hypothetical protein
MIRHKEDLNFRVWLPETAKEAPSMTYFLAGELNDLHYAMYNEGVMMQGTGFKDSNKKEVFEGDIVYTSLLQKNLDTESEWVDNLEVQKVVYSKEKAMFCLLNVDGALNPLDGSNWDPDVIVNKSIYTLGHQYDTLESLLARLKVHNQLEAVQDRLKTLVGKEVSLV